MAQPIPYDELQRYLRVLAAPGRLELLRKLQVPRAIGEIELAATRRDRERVPGRPLARATIAVHLKRLEEAGLVQARASTREGQPVTEYVLQQARLFVILDELRRVSLLRPRETGDTAVDDTPYVAPATVPESAALLLANGPLEGTAFPLRGKGPWTIGRDPKCDIALAYDPFVSREHARLVAGARGAFALTALASAANPTSINWSPLPERGERILVPGDIIGAGRSLLVFRGGAS